MQNKLIEIAAERAALQILSKVRRRLRLFALSVLSALALGFVSQARAVDFEQGVSAILAKLNSLPSRLRGEKFREQSTPLMWTPDQGVYGFYTGDKGRGAVYWSEGTGAHVVYGEILNYWESQQYETRLGYPDEDEKGRDDACPNGNKRSQRFKAFATGTNSGPIGFCTTVLCWNGSFVEEAPGPCS